jgi:hypothetical protein
LHSAFFSRTAAEASVTKAKANTTADLKNCIVAGRINESGEYE